MSAVPNESEPSHCERFQTNMNDMINDISDIIGTLNERNLTKISPEIIRYVGLFINAYDKKKNLENFIFYSYKSWGEIHSRDEQPTAGSRTAH